MNRRQKVGRGVPAEPQRVRLTETVRPTPLARRQKVGRGVLAEPLRLRLNGTVRPTLLAWLQRAVPVRALVLLALACAGARGEATDWDSRLSMADAAANTYQRNMDWSVGKDFDAQPALRRQWLENWKQFVQKHAGTHEAARAELFFIDDRVRREAWAELPTAVAAYLDSHPADVSLHWRALNSLGRSLLNTNVPPAVRRAAFDVFSVRLKNQAQQIYSARNYLVALGLPPGETLALAEQAAYACGSNVNSRTFLWLFLTRAAPAAGADSSDWRAACRRFLAHFGEANPEGRAVQLALLNQDVREGVDGAAARLAEARTTDRAADDALKTAFDALREALAGGRTGPALTAVGAAFGAVVGAAPPYLTEPHWARLLNDKLLPSLPPDLLADLLTVTLELAPSGQATEVARNLSRNSLKGHPQEGPLLIAYLERHVEDIRIATDTALYLTHHVPAVAADPELAARAAQGAMSAALRLGTRDSAAEYAFLCGSAVWSLDRPASERLLEQALALAPDSRHAARAGWLLAFLRGEIDFARPPLPRGDPPPDEAPAIWPAVGSNFVVNFVANFVDKARDKARDKDSLNRAMNPPLAQTEGLASASLVTWDADEDLAAGQLPLAMLAAEQAVQATDGDAASAWMPLHPPAVIVVPLRRASPVRRVVVNTAGACYFAVTLHDAQGRALARAERDWRFPDNSDFWPPEQTALDFLPGAAIHFVSVELTAFRGATGGIAGLAVFGTQHPLEAAHEFPPAALPASAKALRIAWQADEPVSRERYRANLESARGFVITRWINPWPRADGAIRLDSIGGHLGLVCYGGANVTLRLDRAGIVDWRFAEGASGTVTQTNAAEAAYGLCPLLEPGRHHFTIGRRALPAAGDRWGADDIRFVSLELDGRARVGGAIRFSDGRSRWDAWLGPLTNGAAVAVPAGATHYQLRADFDSREVLGQATARLAQWNIAAVPTGSTVPIVPPPPAPSPRSSLAEVCALVAARGVVATYPRAGCRAEYDAAKRIADRAGIYLVSDDHALNNYDGLPLVVGRPLVHRYARQAIAMAGLWNDPGYLNSPTGLVDVVRKSDGTPWYVLAIGETPAAVEAAAARLLAGLPARPAPRVPFRAFAADTLEVIYAWQLHPERPAAETLPLQIGVNDRRSLQFGIAAERELADLRAELGELRRADGAVLKASAQVRFCGFYEWDGFFGELRLPNALLPAPYLPMPANTALGVWVTVHTDKGAQPGLYEGVLSLRGGGHLQPVRVQVTVEPVVLPDSGPTAFYSFAHPAWWFKAGTPQHERAVRELARNEARHGVQWLGTRVAWRLSRAGDNVLPGGTALPESQNNQELRKAGKEAHIPDFLSSRFKGDALLFTLDFAPWEEHLQRCEEEYAALGYDLPGFLGAFEDLNALVRISGTNDTAWVERQAAEQVAAFLKRTGRSKRFILKVSDEPRSLEEWMIHARPWREGGVRVMTCHSGNDATLESAAGTMDPWCPNYQHDVLKPFFRERQQAGDAVWWYCCGVPPTRLTGRPEDNLPFYWLTAKWRFTGAMSYAAHSLSPHSTETSPVPFRYEHGLSHRLLFLPDGTLLDTWRRELEGDGIRDNMLIEHIRGRIAEMRRQPAARARADALMAKLDALLERVVPYKYGYANTLEAWQNARGELYDLAVVCEN